MPILHSKDQSLACQHRQRRESRQYFMTLWMKQPRIQQIVSMNTTSQFPRQPGRNIRIQLPAIMRPFASHPGCDSFTLIAEYFETDSHRVSNVSAFREPSQSFDTRRLNSVPCRDAANSTYFRNNATKDVSCTLGRGFQHSSRGAGCCRGTWTVSSHSIS